MADAFRGLTIRIGADARPVKSALDSISRSASATQKQLNKMTKALKFDPTDTRALGHAIDLADDKAAHMAMSLRIANTAIEQAKASAKDFGKSSALAGKSLEQAAAGAKNINARIQQTREYAKTTNAQLQHMYDAAKSIMASKIHGPFQSAEEKAKAADEAVKRIQADLSKVGPKADSAAASMKKLITEAVKHPNMNLAEKFGVEKTEAGAEKLYGTLVKLRQKSAEFDSDLKELGQVAGLRALQVEAAAYESALREAVTETVRLKTEMAGIGNAPGLKEAKNELKTVSTATQAAVEHARAMDEAYRALPRNLEIARAKVVATKNAQEALKQQVEATKDAMKKLESSPGFDKAAASSRNVYLDFERAKSAATDAGVAVKKLEQEMNGLQHKKLEFIGPQSESELKELNADIARVGSELADARTKAMLLDDALDQASKHKLYADMGDDLMRARAEMEKLSTKARVFDKLQNVGAGMRELGYGLYSTVTPAIMMAGRYAIQAAEDIDSSYRDMRKTVNGTEEEFEHLKQAAMDYSTTHVTSADQILEIEAMGGQLGLAVTDLEAFSTTISNLDIATNIDADTAAEQLGKMASVLGITSDEYDNFGDSLVRLGNNMPVMESDIMTLMMRFMGMGKVVGMSADEMLGWSAAASATGQKSEAAGSSMQRFISKVETAVTSGGEDLETFASIAGMSADEFAKSFRDNASGAMREFIAGLGEMQKNGESVNQALMDLGINNVRDKQLLEGLAVQMANAADGTSELDYALRLSSEAYRGLESRTRDGSIEKAGDAAREAAKKSEGFSGSLKILRNQAAVLGSTLAEGATPFIKDMAVMFGDLTDTIREMPESMRTATVGALGFAAALGPVFVAGGTIGRALSSIAKAAGSMQKGIGLAGVKLLEFGSRLDPIGPRAAGASKGMAKAGVAAKGLGKALQFAGTGPGMLAIVGITAAIKFLADGIAKTVEKSEQLNKATSGLADATGNITTMAGTVGSAIEQTGQYTHRAAVDIDALIEKHNSLVDSMNERANAAREEIGQLNEARNIINRYTNKDLSDNISAQGQLATAIDVVNQKCGTHYQVVDAANGKIADEKGVLLDTTDAINSYVVAKTRAIELDSLIASRTETKTQLDEEVAAYSKATEDFLNAQKRAEETRNQYNVNEDQLTQVNSELAEYELKMNNAKTAMDQTQKSLEAQDNRIGALQQSADKATASIISLAEGEGAIANTFGEDTTGLHQFSAELDQCGLTMDDFYNVTGPQWGEIIAQWRTGGGDLSAILSSMGIEVKNLSDQFSAEMAKVAGSGNAFHELAVVADMTDNELASSLKNAGISAQSFASMSKSAFSALVTATNNDFGQIKKAIDLVNAAGFEPKDIEINADGLLEVDGQLIDIDNRKVGDKEFKLTANGLEEVVQQTEQANEAIENYDGSEGTADLYANDNASGVVEGAEGEVENYDGSEGTADLYANDYATDEINQVEGEQISDKDANVNAQTDDAMSDLGEVQDYEFDSKEVEVYVTGGALGELQAIKEAVWEIPESRTVTITTVEVKEQQASGGILPGFATGGISSHALRAVPRHADGGLNGIVTHATMTNVGWVGEAGAEAVFHMRHAGGAIVPLSNRRYVRPFARAVASEMGSSRGNTVVNLNLNYDASDDADALARGVANRLQVLLNTEG